MKEKCVLSDAWIQDLSWGIEFNSNILVRNYFFLKKYSRPTSEGANSHDVFYYQQLSITPYQVSFYGKNYLVQRLSKEIVHFLRKAWNFQHS